jgi:RimJ/RimL family protein N-acetyltransferase
MAETEASRQPVRRVLLQTERFRLAGLVPAQVTQRYCDWFRDPEIAAPLNRPAGAASLSELQADVAAADGITRFAIGIFDGSGEPLGFYSLNRNPTHRTLNFNVVIGEKAWWGKGVVLETRAALLDHFFAERQVDKAIGLPLARNFPAIFNYKRQGWRHEGTLIGQCLAHDGSARLDQLQFGMLAGEWRKLRETGP